MRQRTVNTVKRFAAFLMAFIMTLTNMAFGPGIVYAEEPPIYIRTLTTELFSGAGANNTWTANSSAAGHAFGFRINYAISGIGEVEEAGKVKLVVPASILVDRNSAAADILELSIPSKEDYESGEEIDSDINFAWYREGDNIILYNIRKITAGDNGYIELSYATSKTTYNYVDMADMRPFTCTMTVDNGADGVSTKTAPPITVRINTTATLNSTSKQYPTLFKTWNNSWGAAPADSANYYYLWWPIYSTISATQPYNFSFADSVTAEVSNDEKTWHDVSAEVVAYKFAGQSVFGTGNSVSSQTTTGYRYDYVVTKITASEVDPYDHWRIHNTITATVDPVDQVDPDTTKVSKRTFVWDKPFFKYPTGHFMQYKRADGAYRTYHPLSIYTNSQHAASSVSMKAGYYSRYDLNDFQDGTLVTLGGLDYAAWMVGYPYPWTIEDGVTRDQIMQDPELYFGKVPVEYDLYDDRVYFQHNDSVTMTSDDYRITKLDYSYLMRDAVISSETANFTAVPVTYTDNDIIRFYGNFFGAANAGTPGNWVNFAAANLKTGALTYDSTYVESMSPSSIIFKDTANLTQYRVNAKNAHYYTEIFTVPNIELKHSSYVDSQLAGRDDAGITNHAYAIFRKNDGTVILNTEEADTDYVRITQKNSHIAKSAVAATNNVKKRYYTITWKVNANETITYGAGETGFVPQETGVFYDLLPKGANIDVNSVDVADGNTFLSESSFRVQTVPNYKNTGRTLLIVYIDTEGENFSVYFDTIHSWNSIADFGKDVYNPTAYRTGNSKITNGSADDGGSITENTLMAGLGYLDDNGNDNPADMSGNVYDGSEPRYIYGQRTFDILALTAASAGLIKQVKREGEKNYSYDTYTTINGDYSYRIRFMNAYTTKAKDMIFFDSMENYSITEGRTSSVEHVSDWHGTITGIDLSQLTNAGAAPVLYVSTISDLDVEDHHDITDGSVWTMVPNPDSYNYSDVKAIAIDARRKRSGEDFILDKGESVTATVFMRAPAEAPAVTGDYPYTYNNIYISDTVMSDDTEAGFFIHQDYTSVALKVAGSFGLKKVSSENPSTTIKDIQFRLRGISDYGTEVDQIVSTNSIGEISFNDIELATAGGNGGYILQEYLTNDDWLLDMTEHRVYVDGYGKVWIDGVEYTNGTIVLSNNPRIHGNLRIYKEELGTENDEYPVLVAGCSFRLSGVSDYGTDVNMYAETSVTGVANFRNIELGTYELKEVSSNPYYVPNTETFTVVVDETGRASITSTSEYNTKRENGYDVILNEPRYHNLKLTKKDATDGRTIQGAEFTLTGISDLGNALNVTGVADANGMLVFEDIEKGTYVLKETAAPTGVDEYGHTGTGGVRNYIGDQNEYIVTIARTGNVTINGLQQNGAGFFEVMNERALDGEIIVTKIWDDMVEDGDSRPFPTIHISTIDPTQKKLTITYDADGGKYTDNSTENYVSYLVARAASGTQSTTGTVDLGDGDFEYISENNGWVKNGNTWTYKFHVFDENAKYYLWEDDLTGYESSATPTHYAIINDGTITKHGEVTNREVIDYGALEIRKTVNGAEDSRDFLFDVTLAGTKIFTGSQVIDGIAFTNGKATVKVKHGETLRIEDIPAGTTYTVSEHEYADYTTTYTGSTGTITTDTTSAVAVETGVTGTITANETAVIAATNTHTAPPEEPTNITIQKIVSGYRETENSYTFYMSMRGLHPGITYFTSNDRSFTADENGEANITLTLQNEESVTINGVPVGTIYRVTEEAGDYTASYTVEIGGATIDEGAVNTKDTQLSTADITASEASTVTFTNRIAYSQDLVVKKTLTNGIQGDEEENFEITAEFTDLAANAYYRSDIGRITSDEDGYAIKTFLLKQNESVRFYGLPTGSRYRIKEAAYGKFIATYEITGTNVTAVSASGGNTEAGKEMTTSRELVNQGEEAVVTINNERVMTGSVGLYKHNTEDTPEPLMGAVFQLFRTAASAGTDEDVYIGEYTTNEAGKLTASNLSAGDYYFLEKIAPDGYRISAATFPVTLTQEQIIAQNNDAGGALVDDPSVYPVADAPNMLSTATVTITATKTMTNGTLTAGAYTFVLEKDGTELQRTSNAATGEVAFLPITYHLSDAGKTFTYTVRELANAGTDVYYDTAEYTVTVEVTDDNGELKADIVSITK